MEPKSNYVGLLVLIIFGVAVGNLASSYITAKYLHKENKIISAKEPKDITTIPENSTETKIHDITRETVKLTPESLTEPNSKSEVTPNPTEHKLLIEQRKIDENGLRLAKTCNEWTVVHKDMQTQTSEKGMNKHCAEYYDYLSFGNLPNSN